MRWVAVALLLLWSAAAAAADADDAPAARVTAVAPAQAGDLVVAGLTTTGLPGPKLLQSMRSGMVSSVELDLALMDAGDHVIGGNRVSLQLGFDLWEEVFSVRGDGREQRFAGLEQLQGFLANLGTWPVAPLGELAPAGRYRLRVSLVTHPIAPAQRERVEEVIAGGGPAPRRGQDEQEASVSLGRLIRYFYKGGGGATGGQETYSGWFTRQELRHEPD